MMHLKLAPIITFYILANPKTFKLVRSGLGSWVASADGVPTMAGLALHAVLFSVVLHLLWKFVLHPLSMKLHLKSGYASTDGKEMEDAHFAPAM